MNDVIRNDREFQVPKCQELQGDIYLKLDEQKNLDRAIVQYKLSAEGDPKNFNLMFKLGRCFDRKRDYSESVVYFEKALKIDPKSATVAFKLGWA